MSLKHIKLKTTKQLGAIRPLQWWTALLMLCGVSQAAQTGGLPALADRVAALEAMVAGQSNQIDSLSRQLDSLLRGLETETRARVGGDKLLAFAITNYTDQQVAGEAQARQAADLALSQLFNSGQSTLSNQVASLARLLSAESLARMNADAALSNALFRPPPKSWRLADMLSISSGAVSWGGGGSFNDLGLMPGSNLSALGSLFLAFPPASAGAVLQSARIFKHKTDPPQSGVVARVIILPFGETNSVLSFPSSHYRAASDQFALDAMPTGDWFDVPLVNDISNRVINPMDVVGVVYQPDVGGRVSLWTLYDFRVQ